jgi:hypothetical protein
MPETSTPHYQLEKPEISASKDRWGMLLNGDLDTIDALLFDRLAKTAEGIQYLSNQVNFRGIAYVEGGNLAAGVDTGYVATSAYVERRLSELWNQSIVPTIDARCRFFVNQLLPIGTIVLWKGFQADIPYGWYICNGQAPGGVPTPNLIDRFVIGAGGGYGPGNYGGATSHVHHHTQTPIGYELGGYTSYGYLEPATVYTMPPYYAVCYIMKYLNF